MNKDRTYAVARVHRPGFQSTADQTRTASYGVVGHIAQEFTKGFPGALSADRASDPQPVADLVAVLVQMPAGQRPLKALIGAYTEGVVAVNQAVEPLQQLVLPGLE